MIWVWKKSLKYLYSMYVKEPSFFDRVIQNEFLHLFIDAFRPLEN